MNKKIIILLTFITLLGALFRLHALSPFKFYPDSYQNLLVAENIRTYQSVVGSLGPQGMVFPPFVMWSHPGYPLLILFTQLFIPSSANAAQIIVFITSVLAIPLAFFTIKTILQSKLAGMAAAILLALSFNHTTWSGYIMTEAIGVFFLLLVLWLIWQNISQKSQFANIRDILTGMLFAYAVMTRYEYIMLSIPLSFIIIKQTPSPFLKLLNYCIGFLIVISFILALLFPLPETFLLLLQQHQTHTPTIIGIAAMVILCSILYRFLPKYILRNLSTSIHSLAIIALNLVAIFLCIQIFFPNIHLFRYDLASLRNFLIDDLLLSVMTFIGLLSMLRQKKFHTLAYSVIFSVILLGLLYYRINPEMERYWTHAIPFFLIPASYGLVNLLSVSGLRFSESGLSVFSSSDKTENRRTYQRTSDNRKLITDNRLTEKSKLLLLPVITTLVCYQMYISYTGFRTWGDRSWYRMSYEEKAARIVGEKITDKNILLIASFPEPYYYFTRIPTQSIADTFPYIFIREGNKEQQVLIIQDMGMHDLFPNFSNFLTQNLNEFKTDSFKINEPYHYSHRSENEKFPTVLYKITLQKLREMIEKYHEVK